MLEFLVVGSIWFWLVLFTVAVALTILVETDEGGWATVTLVGTIVVLNYLYKLPILKVIVAHPAATLVWTAVYFAIGAMWGLAKWYFFVHKCLNKYREARNKFLKDKNISVLTPEWAANLQEKLKYDKISVMPPLASDHKADITRWMTYWPFSMIGTLLNDFVRNLWNHIYMVMAETYDRISAHVFRNVMADAEMAKQYADEQTAQKAAADPYFRKRGKD